MAIYHLEAKIISRGSGRSAVAAAAYMSCSRIYNDYDGITHDYTRKRGLVWEKIFLPSNAPAEWQDRAVLWNAVEAAEKSKDSRLARELIVALPIELAPEEHEFILSEFIKRECVAKGMCTDVCYHDTDGHNPHAHIMLTVRPLTAKGTWQAKTQKEYLCIRRGVEKGFTAAEYKLAEKEGWEKQYLYKVDDEKMYLPPSCADGLERINKYPKSTQYGRQNPIYEEWNSEEQLMRFREAWARYVNRSLDLCELDTRIDHRSHKARGLKVKPTIHVGIFRGVSDRKRINQQIRSDNKLINDLLDAVKYLAKTVGVLISRAASALEEIRTDLLVLTYQKNEIGNELNRCESKAEDVRSDLDKYKSISTELAEKQAERDELFHIKRKTPSLFKGKHKELDAKMYELGEDISELMHSKQAYENRIKLNASSIDAAERDVKFYEGKVAELKPQREKCKKAISEKLDEYHKAEVESADLDQEKLTEARQAIRSAKESEAIDRIEKSGCVCFEDDFYDTKVEVAKLLGEEAPKPPKRKPVEHIAPPIPSWERNKYRKSPEWRNDSRER